MRAGSSALEIRELSGSHYLYFCWHWNAPIHHKVAAIFYGQFVCGYLENKESGVGQRKFPSFFVRSRCMGSPMEKGSREWGVGNRGKGLFSFVVAANSP